MKNEVIKEIEAELAAKKNAVPVRFITEVQTCANPSMESYSRGCRCADCVYIARQYRKKYGKKCKS